MRGGIVLKIWITLVTVLLVMMTTFGCSAGAQEDVQNPDEQHEQTPTHSEGNAPDDSETNNGNQQNEQEPDPTAVNSFELDIATLSKESFNKGQIANLPFAIGSSFDDILDEWGVPY